MPSFPLLLLLLLHVTLTTASDTSALLSLKSSVDPTNTLPWPSPSPLCNWTGVKQCHPTTHRITKLVIEFSNLTGTLPSHLLSPLNQLRVLSLKSNLLSGPIPDLSNLSNLKSIFLQNNRFSGTIPPSLPSLHRLKVIVLSNNDLAGSIPERLTALPRLYTLLLDRNRLVGPVPGFNQLGLEYFNVSFNNLAGKIPATASLTKFDFSAFSNNSRLCGVQIDTPCLISIGNTNIRPSPAPVAGARRKRRRRRVTVIVGSSVGAFLLLSICLIVTGCYMMNKKGRRSSVKAQSGEAPQTPAGSSGKRGFSWEAAEGLGRLVFCGGVGEMYSLEDLLKASAETLGRGTVGSTYKAVMESGFIVTVKRLKESGRPGPEEFRRRMEVLGRLRQPNLVPVRAYFQAKEERLLVYDYFPNGSLFSLIHGSRPSGSGKPLHWTSCLKIAEDVATGLLYLHNTPNTIHGNLKSSNVLLGSDFESCLTDYGLVPAFQAPDTSEDSSSATALFYRAPEACQNHRNFTPQADIYSFGVLLLELLTGKTPFQDLVEEHRADIPRWVRSVREEETESGEEPSSGTDSSEEKLSALLNVAVACVAAAPDRRPATKDVLRMIREARADVVVSSGSEHSPARWSDTVQSLPREHGTDHPNFAERD